MKKNILLFMPILLLTVLKTQAQGTVQVTVNEVENGKGKLIVMLFNEEEGFPMEKAKAYKEANLEAQVGKMVHTFSNLPFDTYAVSIVHDENENGEVDRNFVGFPKEKVGASFQKGLGKPSFKKSQFTISETQKTISLDMQFIN
ncbi:MAG: DUF2141 domain-containing protein [Bacteroidota bacterium]